MTARLTRLLKTLDDAEKRMERTPALRRYGRLTRATGLVLEATGLQLPLGATCLIERHDGDNADPDRPPLAVGLFVEAVIKGRPATGVVVLPRSALR